MKTSRLFLIHEPVFGLLSLSRIVKLSILFMTIWTIQLLPAQGIEVIQGSSNQSGQTGGFAWIGDPEGQYLSFDENSIQARFHFGDNTLRLNQFGGSIDLLGSGNTSGNLAIDGTGLFYNNLFNRVGIGTNAPNETLDVNGNTRTHGLKLTGTAGSDDGYIQSVEGTSADIFLVSNDNIRFDLDNDHTESGEFEVFNGTNSKILSLLETGGMTVKGSIIKLSKIDDSKSIEFNTTGAAVDINSYNANLFLTATSGRVVIMQEFAGQVGIGTNDPQYKLHVNGSAGKPGGGSWSNSSDLRLKKDIKEFNEGLDLIEKVNPVYFHYNGKDDLPTDQEYVGVIAQELQNSAPFMVSEYVGKEGEHYLAVDPSAFDFILINAVKELSAEVKSLKMEIGKLKNKETTFSGN